VGGRLALVAGHGALVPEALAAAKQQGWDVVVFDLAARQDLAADNPVAISFDDIGGMLASLRESGASHLCAIGALEISDAQRRGFARAVNLPATAGGINDRSMSEAFAAAAARSGLTILGIDELKPELVAPEGHFGGPAEKVPPLPLAANALRVAKAVGALDLGQAAIVSDDRAVAAEGIERTSGLIERVGEYVAAGLVDAKGSHLILAKGLKPNQPRYVDMPAIGPDTVDASARAGISAIVVEAGGTLLIERRRLVEAAETLGVALVGLTPDG
jgi:DUF1009 family protein